MSSSLIRIVYFIGQLGLGGSERQLYLLLKYMDKARFEPHVVVFNPSPNYTLDEDLRRHGVVVHAIPENIRGIPHRSIWLFRLLRSIRPQILHSWSVHDNAYAAVVGRLARVPILIGSERVSLSDPDFDALGKVVQWLVLFGVHKQMVNAQSIANELFARGVRQEDVFVLPNCVECTSDLPASQMLPKDMRIVGMVANLRRQKNYPLFIQSILPLLREKPDLMAVMVGQPLPSDPEVPGQISDAITDSGCPERLQWLGFQKDIPQLLQRFNVFCLTSNWEGTPNAILEAMSAGLPVVATRVDGVNDIVKDGVTGILVDPMSVEQVTAAVRRFLDDPALARQMGQAGQELVRKTFGCAPMAARLQDYYQGLLK